ncbi:MAG: hypothetical protein C0617_11820 [Desulfuromonas sp.]|uniref:PilN domain-containing protein n=1 Tax=Desulfuromonas sp. TaxID=892 RepID=UPI000CB16AC7|nr:PilN domain-containing protein [Desulfuromonas sp.]PLX83217.1 MAG: hypothetical protein C0617_11820 [Desulfuromonas sp.]
MHDIDLIPADYRRRRSLLRVLRIYLVLLAAVVAAVALGRVGLGQVLRTEQARVGELKTGEVQLLEQKRRLEELGASREDLRGRLALLEALRGGPPAQRMFEVVDRALNPSVWFSDWKFVREGEAGQAARGGQAGYFLIVPKGEGAFPEEPWRELTRMEIKGQALSHAALAEFVRRLLGQPEIADVHLLNTKTRQYRVGGVIEYELTVEIDCGKVPS